MKKAESKSRGVTAKKVSTPEKTALKRMQKSSNVRDGIYPMAIATTMKAQLATTRPTIDAASRTAKSTRKEEREEEEEEEEEKAL